MDEQRKIAYKITKKALQSGRLVRAEKCEHCGIKPTPIENGDTRIHGHHPDYSKPLDIVWLCTNCHKQLHADMAKPKHSATSKAVIHYRKVEGKLRSQKLDMKPNLSSIARMFKIAKSSLWEALQK